jgi:hypothetical protein
MENVWKYDPNKGHIYGEAWGGKTIPIADIYAGPNRDGLARLFLAAPDLLAACKALLDNMPYQGDEESCECGDGQETDDCCHMQARRAIAKAEGQETRP